MPSTARLSAALPHLAAQSRAAARFPTRGAVVREGALQTGFVALGIGEAMAVVPADPVSPVETAALVVATGAVLFARRVWPAAALVAAALLLDARSFGAGLSVPVVAFAAGRRLPPARLCAAVAAAAAVVSWLHSGGELAEEPWSMILAVLAVSVFLVLVIPAALGALVGHSHPAGRLLRDRNARLERARELIAARARAHERARITDEMHDMLGHRLSLLSMHAGAMELRAAQEAHPLSGQARLVRDTAGAALTELRQILQLTQGGAEHGPVRGRDPLAGTRTDLEALVQQSRQAGLDVALSWPGDDVDDIDDIDPRVRETVHRVVREGLTNVHKHAAGTPAVAVEVSVRDGRVNVAVANAAPVPNPARAAGTRRGLVGLEERAALLGGTCRGRRSDDGGFVLTLDVPARPAALHAVASATPVDHQPATADPTPHEPPALRENEVPPARRTVVVVALAVLLAIPIALLVLGIIGGARP